MRSGQLADKFRPLLCPRQDQYRYVIVNLHALAYFADNFSGFSDDPLKIFENFRVVKFRARGSFTISLGNHRVEHPAKRVMSIFLNEHWSRRPLGISTHGIWIGSLHGSAKTAWLVRGFNYTCHGRNRLDPQAVADQVPAERLQQCWRQRSSPRPVPSPKVWPRSSFLLLFPQPISCAAVC